MGTSAYFRFQSVKNGYTMKSFYRHYDGDTAAVIPDLQEMLRFAALDESHCSRSSLSSIANAVYNIAVICEAFGTCLRTVNKTEEGTSVMFLSLDPRNLCWGLEPQDSDSMYCNYKYFITEPAEGDITITISKGHADEGGNMSYQNISHYTLPELMAIKQKAD
jgi:hypothetical protein